MSIPCSVCRSLRHGRKSINQSTIPQLVRQLSSTPVEHTSQSSTRPPVGRVVPIITIHADAQSINQSGQPGQQSSKQSTIQPVRQTNAQSSSQKRHFSTHNLGSQSIDRLSRHDTDTIHHAIEHHDPSTHPSPSASHALNSPLRHEAQIEFMTPVKYTPPGDEDLDKHFMAPFYRALAELIIPYTETLGYKPVFIARRIFNATKGYILAAPPVEKLVWKQTIPEFTAQANKRADNDRSFFRFKSDPPPPEPSTPRIPQLIIDTHTEEHPMAWLFMFVINHRIIIANHEALMKQASNDPTIKESPLGADIPRVHMVLLEDWWNELSHKLGEAVGGLLLNKNLMLRQKRFIAAFYCFEMAINQSVDIPELKHWFNSILARELYGWMELSMTGPPAKLVDELSDWLIDSLGCIDGTNDEKFANGEIKFPVMPVIDPSAVDYTIELSPFVVEGNRLLPVHGQGTQ